MIIRQLQAGFTLLELVVGIAILALITTLLVNVLGTGIAATAQLDRRTERIELAHHVHRLLRERLETVRPLGWQMEGRRLPAFAGEASSIRFVTTRPPWPDLGGLALDWLYLNNGQLTLAERPFAGTYDARTGHSIDIGKTLARGIGTLRVDYFGRPGRQRAAWHREWTHRDLPDLIRVRIAWRDGKRWPDLVVHPQLAPQPR